MRFSAIGISHWKSEVSIRELFYLDNHRRELLDFHTKDIPGGVMMLDTCNRTELYAFCDSEVLISALCKSTNTDRKFFKEHGYVYEEEDAYNHLYKVGTGLDSQVLGDVQIIQQVKQAYKKSKDQLSGEFHQLVQSVFRAHKRSRTETDFGRGTASVGFAATQHALDHFKDLSSINILLVGAGKMGKVSCKNLVSNGAEHISVVNRTIDRAKELASTFDIKAHAFSELDEEIKKADLIIAATGANKPILLPEHFKGVERSQLVLDLSVPRNVEPAVGELEQVTLVDMDSIHEDNQKALEKRENAIPKIKEIIEEEKADFLKGVKRSRYLLPRIKEIDHRLSDITDAELDRVKHKMDDDSYAKMEEVTRRIKKKIMAIHIDRIDKEFEKAQNEA
ncbi:glutamyl-tRNA reductase [Gracilimonas sediminicola]|uniref:Glutamyl-tRNA reductase n=1 Tax=Gracilimonas sediminicola TaxID=2952158 RepID=A0A9X2L538_9BACT|nr:glutamyl-tRNA reductase [Gracilimonas sediminicola]MCP9292449.1 glutamyl-tRNA reductase [Gracilimonas sediminicola]